MPRRRTLLIASAVGIAASGVAGFAARTPVRVVLAENRLKAADSPEARAAAARDLLALGRPAPVAALFADPDPAVCGAVAGVLKEAGAESDGHRLAVAGFDAASPAGKAVILDLAGAGAVELVRAGLAAGSPGEVKVAAIRLARGLDAEVAPLLADADPAVRRAALLAVGPAADDRPAVVPTEELFRCLHDADAGVRDLGAAALRSRGLDLAQISLARQLLHPDAAERLALLVDLANGVVADPGPWLERLSRDADPAVRLGAARVAVEAGVTRAAWLADLARTDANPTVRKWAGYYRDQTAVIRVGGP